MFSRAVCIVFIIVLVVLIWKTLEYFGKLQMHDSSRTLIAWDWLMLVIFLFYLVLKIILK